MVLCHEEVTQDQGAGGPSLGRRLAGLAVERKTMDHLTKSSMSGGDWRITEVYDQLVVL